MKSMTYDGRGCVLTIWTCTLIQRIDLLDRMATLRNMQIQQFGIAGFHVTS